MGVPLVVEVCVDSCDETLAGSFLISRCAIDLACEIEFAQVLCFEGVMELSRWKEVVFDGIARPEHAGVFQAGYLAHRLELGFFGQGCGESIEVGLDGVSPFRLDEDLVAILVRKPVDFVLNARTVAWPLSSDGARKQGAVLEAVLQNVVYGRVGVRDVTGMLVRQVQYFIVAECLGGRVSVLDFCLAEVNASPINSRWSSRFHPACGEPVSGQLICDAFCSPFARPAALKLLGAQVNATLQKGA